MDLINENEFQIQIDQQGKSLFYAIAKWGNFLSIFSFICIGILVIVALFAGQFYGNALAMMSQSNSAMGTMGSMGSMAGGIITAIYLFIAALYFFPTLFHFQYVQKLKKALAQNNTVLFNESLVKLKKVYVFIGVITIIILAIYALIFLIAIVAAMFM